MNKLYNIAKFGLIIILSLTIMFHLLILIGIIPYNIVGGNQLNDYDIILKRERNSIIINLIFLVIVLVKVNFLKLKIPAAVTSSLLWMMVFMFSINTFGNLFSAHTLETVIFTPLFAMLSAFSLVLALTKRV